MTRLALVVALALIAPPAAAAQPHSESLVDSAAIVTIPLRMAPEFGSPEKQRWLQGAADALLEGALAQARTEGRNDPDAHVSALFARMADHREGRGAAFLFTQKFRGWMG